MTGREALRLPLKTVKRINALFAAYHSKAYIGLDPLTTLQQFSAPQDLECGGLIASVVAYGRVETIISSIKDIFGRIESQPYHFITETTFREKRMALRGFRHRFNDGDELALLLQACAQLLREHTSIEQFFNKHLAGTAPSMANAIARFSETIHAIALTIGSSLPGAFSFLVPSPQKGSACKRMNMYLRWMVRPCDGIDLGVWKSIAPSILIIPVDTHISAIARREQLTTRTTADWRMAESITESLRSIDPCDPVRFDFSLCRSGMIDHRREAA